MVYLIRILFFSKHLIKSLIPLNCSLNNIREAGLCQCCVTALHSMVMTSSLSNTHDKRLCWYHLTASVKMDNMDIFFKLYWRTFVLQLTEFVANSSSFFNTLSLRGFCLLVWAKYVLQRFRPSYWNQHLPPCINVSIKNIFRTFKCRD